MQNLYYLNDDQRSIRDLARDIARERMVATISAFFSVLGLLLASIGIFGVASYSVAQRTKELAIRRALGAGRWSVIRESLREASMVFALGLVAGTLAAVALVRLTASAIADLLYGLTATDAANVALAVAVMITVALAAFPQVSYQRLSYARAQELAPIVKRFLSPRGEVVYDTRTNTLIIID